MGLRTVRIPGSKLSDRLGELNGRSVQVVFRDDRSVVGTLSKGTDGKFILETPGAAWYNRKRHRLKVDAGEVFEVIYTEVSAY